MTPKDFETLAGQDVCMYACIMIYLLLFCFQYSNNNVEDALNVLLRTPSI